MRHDGFQMRAGKPKSEQPREPSFFEAVELALNAMLQKIERIDARGTGRDGRDGLFPIRARVGDDGVLVFDMSNGTEFVIGDVRGPQGLTGARGEPGEQGIIGPEGAAGLPGPRGDRGSRGLRGEQGERGVEGKHGDRGERGARGPAGPVIEIEASEPIPLAEHEIARLSMRAVKIGGVVLHVVTSEGD